MTQALRCCKWRHALRRGNGALAQKVREQQDAIAAWRQFDKQLIDAFGKSGTQRNADAEVSLRQKSKESAARIEQINQELARDYPEYRELIDPKPLSVRQSQELLRADEALISYLVTAKETLLWVIRPNQAEIIRIGIPRKTLAKQIGELRKGTDLSSGELPEYPHATAYALYRDIFAPALPYLEGVKHVIVVADGPLQGLPFGLLMRASAPSDKDAPWLIRQYAFSNLPAVTSLRALRRFAKAGSAQEPFIGFGDPILKGKPGQARSVSMEKLFVRGAIADTDEIQGMAALPESADELHAMARTLNAP